VERGQRAVVIVGMLRDAAEALAMDSEVEQVVCRTLALGMQADVAACYALDGGPGGRVVGGHPDRKAASELVGGLPETAADAKPVLLEHRRLGEVLVVVPPAPETGEEVTPRGLAFARRSGFTEYEVLLLQEAVGPLTALLPHAVAATERRERRLAGREAAREYGLTSRELEVLQLLAEGLLATSIASRLSLSPRTVHKHLGNIYDKLGVHDRLVAVSLARQRGLVAS
jgi:DNA-binding CsgD family transcriptional regulator